MNLGNVKETISIIYLIEIVFPYVFIEIYYA